MRKVKVLLADDSAIMRTAIRKALEEDKRVQLVGEASNFAETMQKIADVKPDVLLFDLHLADGRGLSPEFVKSQLSFVKHTVAISFSNDEEAQELAKKCGAMRLLDKMDLYNHLIPSIVMNHPANNAQYVD